MNKKNDETVFDLRTLLQLKRQGLLDDKTYEAFLKNLPDSQENAETIEIKAEEKESRKLVFSL